MSAMRFTETSVYRN